MKEYIAILEKYLSENPLEITECKMEKILDMLGCCYFQSRNTDTKEILGCFEGLNSILQKLSVPEQDAVMGMTYRLCSLYQQEDFRNGVVVGFRLFSELSQQ